MSRRLVPRTGARLVLLDPDDRVLLIEERGVDDGVPFHHWLTPGGGVEAGESLTRAATREATEEIGVRVEVDPHAPELHVQHRQWSWRGTTYDQTDHFFAARVAAAFDPVPAALTEMEQQTTVAMRWWTLAELRASRETFLPPDIVEVVTRAASSPVPPPLLRPAGRVLLVDRRNRVLMINSLQSPGKALRNWVTPGGGCDAGETTREAAVRELAEETGVHAELAIDARPVVVEHAVFAVGPHWLDQTDEYYLVRVEAEPVIRLTGVDAVEQQMMLGVRWWTAAELRASDELIWPVGLADALDRLLGPGDPA